MNDEELQRRFRELSLEVEADAEAKRQAAAEEEARRERERQALVEMRKQELAARDAEALAERDDAGALEDLGEADDDDERPGFFARLFGKKRLSARDALEVAGEARRELDEPRPKKEKSLLWSGGLSFFLGPVGWLYAGSWRESIPGSILYLGAAALLQKFPSFLLMPVMAIALPVSGLIGVAYAWRYNKKGKRVRIFGDKKKKQLPAGK